MKLQCATATLRDAVQLLHPVCPLRTTLPILSNLLVRAENGLLQLTGTDLDVSIRTSIAAEIETEGETTIPVRFLLDALRRLSTDTIAISTDDNNVSMLRAGDKVECSLRGMAPGDFPKFPKIEASGSIEFAAKDLAAMLRYTRYAVSRDETRYVLNGVCFTFGEKFEVVATDGRRLTKHANPAVSQEEVTQLIIPTKSINMIGQMLSEEGTVELRYTANQMEVNVGQTTLVTRLVDGHYPNYNQVIPKTCQHAIELDRRNFLAAVNLATVVTEKSKQAVVRINLQDQRLTISAATADIGEVNDTIEVSYSGEPIDIAFNPTFLTDVCQNVDEDQIVLEVSNATSPVVIRAGEHFLCVIMPMRI
jgi:DNA polymerase-3 subunit beta